MKTSFLPIILLVALCPCGHAQQQQAERKPVYRDAATHEDIVKRMRHVERFNPMKQLAPSEGEDPSVKNQPINIVDSSDILSFNGVTTLVPKKAIIRIPDQYADRVNRHIPGYKVVGWAEFYTLNRGWITPVEVSREQAAGRTPIAEEVQENLRENRNLLIATFHTGPISLLPLKVEEPTVTQINPETSAP